MTHGLHKPWKRLVLLFSCMTGLGSPAQAAPPLVRCHIVTDWSADVGPAIEVLVARPQTTAVTLTLSNEAFAPRAPTPDPLASVYVQIEKRRDFPYGEFGGTLATDAYGRTGQALRIQVFDLEKRGIYRAVFSGSWVAIAGYRSQWPALCYE